MIPPPPDPPESRGERQPRRIEIDPPRCPSHPTPDPGGSLGPRETKGSPRVFRRGCICSRPGFLRGAGRGGGPGRTRGAAAPVEGVRLRDRWSVAWRGAASRTGARRRWRWNARADRREEEVDALARLDSQEERREDPELLPPPAPRPSPSLVDVPWTGTEQRAIGRSRSTRGRTCTALEGDRTVRHGLSSSGVSLAFGPLVRRSCFFRFGGSSSRVWRTRSPCNLKTGIESDGLDAQQLPYDGSTG